MKKQNEMHAHLMIVCGLVFVLLIACKKDEQSAPDPQQQETVTDIDGNVYHTVTIGSQVWMVENLKTTRFRNGDSIPNVSDSIQWTTLTTSGYCNVNNDVSTVSVYGRFYNFYAATDSRSIAPPGWHIPSDAEWTTLMNYLGSNAGGMLKETGTNYWSSPNTGATNSTGFTARAAGDRSNTALFHYLGQYACWWSTSEYSTTDGWEYVLRYNSGGYTRMSYSKGLGLSIRCVKD